MTTIIDEYEAWVLRFTVDGNQRYGGTYYRNRDEARFDARLVRGNGRKATPVRVRVTVEEIK